MGNCQAAEAATVVIQHPGGRKVERIYWSVRANDVMASNPGHYVALVINTSTTTTATTTTDNGGGVPVVVKQLKLLRPDDTLFMGHVYRLVTHQEVAKEYAAKKCVKLGKLLKENGGLGADMNNSLSRPTQTQQNVHEAKNLGNNISDRSRATRGGQRRQHGGGGGPWKPALHSISEIGN